MTFPINTNSPIAETVMVFHGMHSINYVMGNHALQFADKASEDLHFGNGHEFCFLKCADVAGDRGEVLIDTGETTVNCEFSSEMLPFKMLSSQVCLQVGEFGQGRFTVQSSGAARLFCRTEAGRMQGESAFSPNKNAWLGRYINASGAVNVSNVLPTTIGSQVSRMGGWQNSP